MKAFCLVPLELYLEGDAVKVAAAINFEVSPGIPERGASWSDPGWPAEPAEISIGPVELVLTDEHGWSRFEPCPGWLRDALQNSDSVYQTLGEAANWGVQERDPDDWYDDRSLDQ